MHRTATMAAVIAGALPVVPAAAEDTAEAPSPQEQHEAIPDDPDFHPPRDKSAYTLFDPTPPELRRPRSADRPDVTESPYTVDAGAVQLEMSFIDYAKNGDVDRLTLAPFNLKVGLLNNTDVQFVFDPYIHEDAGDDSHDGVGDTQIRLKINLWGNDRGDSAFGVMPFVKIPTASDGLGNDEVEGGLIFPFATAIASGVDLGLMGEFDLVFDETDDDYDLEFVHTAAVGVELSDAWGWYIEGVGVLSGDADNDYRALLGTGFTYALSPDAVLDVGTNIGLHGDADDFSIFSGVTIRF